MALEIQVYELAQGQPELLEVLASFSGPEEAVEVGRCAVALAQQVRLKRLKVCLAQGGGAVCRSGRGRRSGRGALESTAFTSFSRVLVDVFSMLFVAFSMF